jgi:hypothetical protein
MVELRVATQWASSGSECVCVWVCVWVCDDSDGAAFVSCPRALFDLVRDFVLIESRCLQRRSLLCVSFDLLLYPIPPLVSSLVSSHNVEETRTATAPGAS